MTLRIAVIGGGVIGCSVAYHLAARSLGQVTLFERDRLSSGTTWHSAGNITWKPHGDEDAPILYAFDLIEHLEQGGEQSTGWLPLGRLFLALSEDGLGKFEAFHQAATERGVDCRCADVVLARAGRRSVDGSTGPLGRHRYGPANARHRPVRWDGRYTGLDRRPRLASHR